MPGPDVGHGDTEVHADALAAQDLGDVVVRLVRERAEQGVAEVDDVDLRGRHGEVTELRGQRVVDHVRERAGELDARRPTADDDEVQRALVDQGGVAIGGLEHAEDLRAQPRRVIEGVERERVVRRARGAEEVRLRSGRQHDRVPAVLAPVRGRDGQLLRIERGHVLELDVDVRPVVEQAAQRVGDVGRRELARRDLVEQRLELVVVVAVQQRDLDVVLLRQPLRGPDAGEAAADDDDVALSVATVRWHAGLHSPG